MPGDRWQQLANLRALLAWMWAHPGKQLLFMGSELAQVQEWAEHRSLDWHLLDDPAHAALGRWVADLNRVYREQPALYRLDCDPEGFEWLDPNDADHSVIGLVRRGGEGTEPLVAVFNFTPVPREGYRIGAPAPGRWRELLNSDAADYGASGAGNLGGVEAVDEPLHGQPWSMTLTVPPLGMLLLAPAGGGRR
jgi:1,4-alpha-glucan branching enzyme